MCWVIRHQIATKYYISIYIWNWELSWTRQIYVERSHWKIIYILWHKKVMFHCNRWFSCKHVHVFCKKDMDNFNSTVDDNLTCTCRFCCCVQKLDYIHCRCGHNYLGWLWIYMIVWKQGFIIMGALYIVLNKSTRSSVC